MKKLAISFLLSFVLVVSWMAVSVGLMLAGIVSEETSFTMISPLRLPVYISEDFFGISPADFGEFASDSQVPHFLFMLYSIGFNVLLFGFMIAYILIVFSATRKEPRKVSKFDSPPEPPTFDKKSP